MIESVAICIEKISGNKPLTEDQGKRILEKFLKEKHYPDLGLELRDLIEISIHYTNLNPTVILSEDFKKLFDKEGKLKVAQKVYLDIRNEKDAPVYDEIKSKAVSYFSKVKEVKIQRIVAGLSLQYSLVPLVRWENIYYLEDRLLGSLIFETKHKLVSKIRESIETFDLTLLKSRLEDPIDLELFLKISKRIVDNIHEKRS